MRELENVGPHLRLCRESPRCIGGPNHPPGVREGILSVILCFSGFVLRTPGQNRGSFGSFDGPDLSRPSTEVGTQDDRMMRG